MIYSQWAEQAKNNFSKLPDNELWRLAYSTDPDTAKIANDILLERTNRNRYIKKRYVDNVEFLSIRDELR